MFDVRLRNGITNAELFLLFGFLRTNYQGASAAEGQFALAVAAFDFRGDEGHGAAATALFADVENARDAGEFLADAQGTDVLVFLLAVDELHFRSIQHQARVPDAEGGREGQRDIG